MKINQGEDSSKRKKAPLTADICMVRNNNLSNEAITRTEYSGFQTAFDFFNAELFDGSLPPLLITLQRKANSGGYFAPRRFAGRKKSQIIHEIALNPDGFEAKTDEAYWLTRCATAGRRPSESHRAVATTTPNGRVRWSQ